MAEGNPGTPKEKFVIGAAVGVAGLYLLLVGLGVLPLPSKLNGPIWIVSCIGAIFLLACDAVLIQGLGHANDQGELPAGAPPWLRALQYLLVGVMFAAFAMIASWIAFGPGERAFSGSFWFFGGQISAIVGRALFGFSAVILWLCTLGLAVAGARKLFRRSKNGAASPVKPCIVAFVKVSGRCGDLLAALGRGCGWCRLHLRIARHSKRPQPRSFGANGNGAGFVLGHGLPAILGALHLAELGVGLVLS